MSRVKIQQLVTLLLRKTDLLTEYHQSLCAVLELLDLLKDDQTGTPDMVMENHSRLTNLITSLIDEIDKQVSSLLKQLEGDQSAVITGIWQGRLSEQDCPVWAKEIYQILQHQQNLLRSLGEMNKQAILKTQDIIDHTRKQLKTINQRKAVNNYYANLGQKQVGFLLDVKDNHSTN